MRSLTMEFDEDGVATPGTYAISTVELAGAGEGGKPIASITSAVCDVCGGWATDLSVSGSGTSSGALTDRRVSRQLTVVVYACPDHRDEIMDSLCDEYGWASNAYGPDELATKVAR